MTERPLALCALLCTSALLLAVTGCDSKNEQHSDKHKPPSPVSANPRPRLPTPTMEVPGPTMGARDSGERSHLDPAIHAARLQKQLSLSEEQKREVERILAADRSLRDTQDAIKAVLQGQQLRQYEAMLAKRPLQRTPSTGKRGHDRRRATVGPGTAVDGPRGRHSLANRRRS